MARNKVDVWDPILGESVTVRGHEMDRPGLEQIAEMSEAEREAKGLELDATEFPVLLRSDMRTDPVEGTHGSFCVLIDLPSSEKYDVDACPRCGYDRAEFQVASTLGGVEGVECRACGYHIVPFR